MRSSCLVEAPAAEHVAQGGDVVGDHVQPRVLRQVAQAAVEADRAARSLVGAPDDLEHGGLAGAVAAHQADLLTGAHGEAHAVDEGHATHIDPKVRHLQHGDPGCQTEGQTPTIWSEPSCGGDRQRGVLFADIVATSAAVAATSARSAKSAALGELLGHLDPHEVEPAVGFLTGEVRQGRIGVGWASLQAAERDPAVVATLTVADVDAAITSLAGLGAQARRRPDRPSSATCSAARPRARATFLTRLIGGELRQGALAGVMTDAVAKASGLPATVVRRAIMLGGRLDVVARIALTEGRPGLEAVELLVGRPVQPMLASTAASVTEAIDQLGAAAVEWKLDGIRIQVHRNGTDVAVYTRNLNDITDRLPGVADLVRTFPGPGVRARRRGAGGGRWRPAGPSRSRTRRAASEPRARAAAVARRSSTSCHLDGRDLIDEPLSVRRPLLAELTGEHRIPGTITDDPAVGEAVLASALAAGHEGVVVKGVDSPYEAGRRGKAWRKVKPVHTLDLVVLAVEWGHGRRTGWLSNLHLGARAADGDGFVMVGKTFKGLTDDLLRWQTERFLALAEREEPWGGPQTGVVWVRPEQVVEIALDGVQRSTRYPGGVALRFARVVRYRDDKRPDEADPIGTVQAMLAR